MEGYLKVRPACMVCGERMDLHSADDGPAYLTIVIVGKVLAPVMVWYYARYTPEPLVLATIFVVAAVAMSLVLLPRLKGFIVALQWAYRMAGFGRV